MADDDPASHPDEDNPGWTPHEIRHARPALAAIAEVFGPAAAEIPRRGRGRPVKADKKINQTLRLDPDVLHAYRRTGSGWQALMNRVLRDHMPARGD